MLCMYVYIYIYCIYIYIEREREKYTYVRQLAPPGLPDLNVDTLQLHVPAARALLGGPSNRNNNIIISIKL